MTTNTNRNAPHALVLGITMLAVQSSTLAGIGYDAPTSTLQIDFNDNPDKVYQFHDVPAEAFKDFEAADSKGSWFYQHIKNKVPFTRFDRETGAMQKTWAPEAEQVETREDSQQAAA